jgi:hypothetical protein
MSDWLTIGYLLEVPLIIAASALSVWVVKTKLKKRMEAKLGRKVEDRELVSISSWMNAPDVPQMKRNR